MTAQRRYTPRSDPHGTLHPSQSCLSGEAPNFGPAVRRMLLVPGASPTIWLETHTVSVTWERVPSGLRASDLSSGAGRAGSRLDAAAVSQVSPLAGTRGAALGI